MTRQPKILVTGATGFLGTRLAARLVDEGYPVRALVRPTSNVGGLERLGVEIAVGDLGNKSSIAAAVKGMDVVVHAGAGTSGTAKDSETATIQGTQNILAFCGTSQVAKLVYISSCSVYEVAGYGENQVVTEDAQLERYPLRRGHYSAAKLRAEALVKDSMNRRCCPTVVLRLGTLYGPGADVYTRMMGVSLARRLFLVFGARANLLPLVHVENAVDAIVECIRNSAADNQVFNVVDHERVTKKMYMDRLVRPLYPNAIAIYCPMSVLIPLTWFQDKLMTVLGRQPLLTVYRLMSSQKRITYGTSRIEDAIGWHSRISFEQGAAQLVREHGRVADSSAPLPPRQLP